MVETLLLCSKQWNTFLSQIQIFSLYWQHTNTGTMRVATNSFENCFQNCPFMGVKEICLTKPLLLLSEKTILWNWETQKYEPFLLHVIHKDMSVSWQRIRRNLLFSLEIFCLWEEQVSSLKGTQIKNTAAFSIFLNRLTDQLIYSTVMSMEQTTCDSVCLLLERLLLDMRSKLRASDWENFSLMESLELESN